MYYPIYFEDNKICPKCYSNSLTLLDNESRPISNNLLQSEQLYTMKTAVGYLKCNACKSIFHIDWKKSEDNDEYLPYPLVDEDVSIFPKDKSS